MFPDRLDLRVFEPKYQQVLSSYQTIVAMIDAHYSLKNLLAFIHVERVNAQPSLTSTSDNIFCWETGSGKMLSIYSVAGMPQINVTVTQVAEGDVELTYDVPVADVPGAELRPFTIRSIKELYGRLNEIVSENGRVGSRRDPVAEAFAAQIQKAATRELPSPYRKTYTQYELEQFGDVVTWVGIMQQQYVLCHVAVETITKNTIALEEYTEAAKKRAAGDAEKLSGVAQREVWDITSELQAEKSKQLAQLPGYREKLTDFLNRAAEKLENFPKILIEYLDQEKTIFIKTVESFQHPDITEGRLDKLSSLDVYVVSTAFSSPAADTALSPAHRLTHNEAVYETVVATLAGLPSTLLRFDIPLLAFLKRDIDQLHQQWLKERSAGTLPAMAMTPCAAGSPTIFEALVKSPRSSRVSSPVTFDSVEGKPLLDELPSGLPALVTDVERVFDALRQQLVELLGWPVIVMSQYYRSSSPHIFAIPSAEGWEPGSISVNVGWPEEKSL